MITTDRGIRRVNKMFLNHDFPTDVITFDLSRDELSRRKGVRVRQVDGEMYVSAVTAARQAQVFGVPPQRELLLYITHGILHLLGYDDHTAVERKAMRMKEKEVLMFIQALPRGEGPEADFLERCFPR